MYFSEIATDTNEIDLVVVGKGQKSVKSHTIMSCIG